MANRDDEDIQHKGRKLWQALKSDPVDHQKIRDLLRNGAPANFREPGVEVRYVHKYMFRYFGIVVKLISLILQI